MEGVGLRMKNEKDDIEGCNGFPLNLGTYLLIGTHNLFRSPSALVLGFDLLSCSCAMLRRAFQNMGLYCAQIWVGLFLLLLVKVKSTPRFELGWEFDNNQNV